MPIFQFVKELLTKRKFADLSQEQNEALIDALAAAKAIDGELLDAEREELMEIVEKLDWDSGRRMETYIDQSVRRATEIEPAPAQLDEYFDDIGDRLQEDWLQQEAYYLASRVVVADEYIDENETLLLRAMVEGFELDPARQEAIMARVRRETDAL